MSLALEGLPANLTAERSVLGAILLNEQLLPDVEAALRPAEFHLDAHRKIFTAMVSMSRAGKAVDFITLGDELEKRGELDSVGGHAYLTTLTDGLPMGLNVEHYCSIVRSRAMLRELLWIAQETSQGVLAGKEPEDVANRIETQIFSLRARTSKKIECMATVVPKAMDELDENIRRRREREDEALGVTTGIPALDRMTGGIRPGEFWAVGGFTSTGKSTLGIGAAHAAAKQGIGVVYMTPEMSETQVAMRLIARDGNLSLWKMRNGLLNRGEMDDFGTAASRVAGYPVWVDDRSRPPVSELVANTKVLVRRHKAKIVIVDYIQKLRSPGFQNQTAEMADIANALFDLAKGENVAVMALSQFRRPERGPLYPLPNLHDFKSSGEIENDADVAILIHQKSQHEYDLVLAKQRNGPTGSFQVHFDSKTVGFYGVDDDRAVEETQKSMRF